MTVEWTEVDQSVLGYASELIDQYHEDLLDARIGFVFRSEAPMSQGKMTLGHAQKVDAKLKPHLQTEMDFIIWLAKDEWDRMREYERKALIDHELCHCRIKYGQPVMRGHDIEEFIEIIDRWGFWTRALFAATTAVKKALQLDLGLEISERKATQRGGVVAVTPSTMPSPVEG